jgi:hypothetical protein
VGNVEIALGQDLLDIVPAPGEAEMEAGRVSEKLGREATTGGGDRLHALVLPATSVAAGMSAATPWVGLRKKERAAWQSTPIPRSWSRSLPA